MDMIEKHDQPINAVRQIVKELQQSHIKKLFVASNITIPTIDNIDTRWKSSYLMIKSMVDNREFFKNSYDTVISNESWLFMEKFVKTFQPTDDCARELQANVFCIGDYLTSYMKLKLKLRNLGSDLATEMLNHVVIRQPNIIRNDAIKAVLYIDPRYNFAGSTSGGYLSNDDKKRAEVISKIPHLFKTVK